MSLRYWRNVLPARVSSRDDERRRRGRIRTPGIVCSLGEVLDLSATGLRILAAGRPACAVGQRVNMTILGPSGPFVVAVRPVWIKRVGFFKSEIGACFEDLDEATRGQILGLVRTVTSEPQNHAYPGA